MKFSFSLKVLKGALKYPDFVSSQSWVVLDHFYGANHYSFFFHEHLKKGDIWPTFYRPGTSDSYTSVIYFVFITIISVWSYISISYLKINN